MVCILLSVSAFSLRLFSVGTVRSCNHCVSRARCLRPESQQEGECRYLICRLGPPTIVRVHTVRASTLKHRLGEEMANKCCPGWNIGVGLAYPPETSLLFRLFSSFLGVTQGLAYGSPGKYTLIGSFNSLSFLSSLHPLLLSGTAIFTAVLYTNYLHRFNLNSVLLYSGLAVVSFLLFSGPVASWVWLLPLGLLYAIFKEKDSLAAMTLPFGTAIAFTMVSYLTGSAYFLLGTIGYPILPAIEGVRNGLEIFTITATSAAIVFLYYFLRPNHATVGRTLLASSALILTVYLLAYFWMGVYVA